MCNLKNRLQILVTKSASAGHLFAKNVVCGDLTAGIMLAVNELLLPGAPSYAYYPTSFGMQLIFFGGTALAPAVNEKLYIGIVW